MPAAMAQCQVQNTALSQGSAIQHRVPLGEPLITHEARRFAFEFNIQQDIDIGALVDQVLLIHYFKVFNACDQRIIRLSHAHGERANGRMRGELAPQGFHEVTGPVRGIDQAIVQETQDGIGAVQCIPTTALLKPMAQCLLLIKAGYNFARIGNQKVRIRYRFNI